MSGKHKSEYYIFEMPSDYNVGNMRRSLRTMKSPGYDRSPPYAIVVNWVLLDSTLRVSVFSSSPTFLSPW